MTPIAELRERHHLTAPMTLEQASRNIELARHHGTTGYLAGWEHKATRCADETIAALVLEIDRLTGERDALRTRLEIPEPPFEAYDGIHCRDETIKGVDEKAARYFARAQAAEQRCAILQGECDAKRDIIAGLEAERDAAVRTNAANIEGHSLVTVALQRDLGKEIDAIRTEAIEQCAKVAASWGHLDNASYAKADPSERRDHTVGHLIAREIRALAQTGRG